MSDHWSVSCAGLDMSTSLGAELQMDVSTLQRPMLLLDVSTPQVTELHQCLHITEACAAPERVCSTEDLSGQQDPILYCSWTCLRYNRGLSCTWTCPHYRCPCFNWTCLYNSGVPRCTWVLVFIFQNRGQSWFFIYFILHFLRARCSLERAGGVKIYHFYM